MPLQHDPSTHDAIGSLFSTTEDKVSAVVSVSMISSPFWLHYIKEVSDVAAMFVPILGCVYLTLQIGFKLWDRAGEK